MISEASAAWSDTDESPHLDHTITPTTQFPSRGRYVADEGEGKEKNQALPVLDERKTMQASRPTDIQRTEEHRGYREEDWRTQPAVSYRKLRPIPQVHIAYPKRFDNRIETQNLEHQHLMGLYDRRSQYIDHRTYLENMEFRHPVSSTRLRENIRQAEADIIAVNDEIREVEGMSLESYYYDNGFMAATGAPFGEPTIPSSRSVPAAVPSSGSTDANAGRL